ncbi:hypothetical protein CEE37_01230 [candidate division LCP-89 bacterium B3_LCP]|uniref:Uncharacterized protein n=1 Tax=candidate division LCP-89 bacterium B3_LCP TaxID=2012998 RepID=A0A532V5B4_UNCL8|nr:MAG: hypothetical protein CEE37_01230 [candidate division LCP-89 bacterium B3_LCP]
MPNSQSDKKPIWIDITIITGIAFLLRMVYILQLKSTVFFDAPIIDAEYHDAWAREIIRQGIGHEGVFFRAPLYPYFLALVYYFSEGSYLTARIVQIFVGTGTAVITYILARSLKLSRTICVLSSLGVAAYGLLIYFDGELLVETLFLLLFLSACLTYALSRRSMNSWWSFFPGLILGLAAITRPSALILLPIFMLDGIFFTRIYFRWQKRALRSLILIVGCLTPIIPVTWHNVQKGGDFVPVAYQGGINFYIGNNVEADGLHSSFPGLGSNWDVPATSRLAYETEGRILKPSEVSSFYYKKGLEFIRDNPVSWMKLMAKKVYAFGNGLEVSNNRDLYFFKGETPIMPLLRMLGFWVIGPLGLVGWIITWRQKILPGWFLAILPVYGLSVIAFFVTARFRLPMIPFLLIFSAIVVAFLFQAKPTFWSAQKGKTLIALILAFLLVNSNFAGIERENSAHSYFSLGNAHLEKGNLDKARKSYHSALNADSTYWQVHLNLGVIAYRMGDLEEADSLYRKELEINPLDARTHNNIGAILSDRNKWGEAKIHYERALELKPDYTDAVINLAQCYFRIGLQGAQAGETERAAAHFNAACELDPYQALYHYNFALALGKLGYLDETKEQLEKTLLLYPDYKPAIDLLRQLD